MKKLLLILLCLPMIGFGQNVFIPDANFKAYLVGNTAINTNGDTEIQVSEANSFNSGIVCSYMNIADFTGIEAFTALTSLHCNGNYLTTSGTIDVSQNLALTYLNCDDCSFISLDVSQNTSLTSLGCLANLFTSLDVSQNTALEELSCAFNQIDTLDVSNNTALESLFCGWNQLTSLNVSNNTALTNLECNYNNLTSLDVRNGNNLNMLIFESSNNPSLTCIAVDDVSHSTTYWSSGIDIQQYFLVDCNGGGGCTDSLACNYDSTATIDDLSCGYPSSNSTTATACDSYTWSVDGNTYTTSGTYLNVSTNSSGCPHTETLILSINNSTSSIDTHVACNQFMWYCDGH